MSDTSLLNILTREEVKGELRDLLASAGWKVAMAVLDAQIERVELQVMNATSPHEMAVNVGKLKALKEMPRIIESYATVNNQPSPGLARERV